MRTGDPPIILSESSIALIPAQQESRSHLGTAVRLASLLVAVIAIPFGLILVFGSFENLTLAGVLYSLVAVGSGVVLVVAAFVAHGRARVAWTWSGPLSSPGARGRSHLGNPGPGRRNFPCRVSPISSNAQILAQSWGDLGSEDRNEMLETINSQANHLGHIVSDLIDVARDRLQNVSLTRIDYSVDELVREAVAATGLRARSGSGPIPMPESGSIRIGCARCSPT